MKKRQRGAPATANIYVHATGELGQIKDAVFALHADFRALQNALQQWQNRTAMTYFTQAQTATQNAIAAAIRAGTVVRQRRPK